MSFRLKGAEREYEFDFTGTNAMCRIEDATGVAWPVAIAALAKSARVGFVRTVVGAALIDPANQTPEQIGSIIDDVGGARVFAAAAAQVIEATRAALPKTYRKGKGRRRVRR